MALKCDGEFIVLRRELKQQIALLHQLTSGKVDLEQKSIEPASYLHFAGGRHRSFVFQDFARRLLLAGGRLDRQASGI